MLPADPKVTALLRARYAAVLEFMPGRASEAQRWREAAEAGWQAEAVGVPLTVRDIQAGVWVRVWKAEPRQNQDWILKCLHGG